MNTHGEETIRRFARAALTGTFARMACAYWTTVFPLVSAHVRRWERAARRIPDPRLRACALDALAKRSNIEGASAFAVLAPLRRRAAAAHAMCAFQGAYNYLDILGEQPSEDPIADGRRLHEALPFALGASDAPLDWYEHHPQRDDGGYLSVLLDECRSAVAKLPSFATAAPAARAAAMRIVAFQSLNLSESQGDHAALEQWARQATPPDSDLQWWETAAAAGSSLGVYVQLAAAARAGLGAAEVAALERAYFPWIGGLHSLLDNLIDKHEDEAAGHRSLLEYYDAHEAALRMRELAERASREARGLPHGRRHVVILAAMIVNYLSSPQARSAQLRPVGEAVLETAGALAGPTMLVFRLRQLDIFG